MSQSSSDDEDDAPHSDGRGNIAAIIAVMVIAALGYWAFNFHRSPAQNAELPRFGASRLRALGTVGSVSSRD